MRELVAKGWLGEIFEVHTVMSKVVDDAARQELAEFEEGFSLNWPAMCSTW